MYHTLKIPSHNPEMSWWVFSTLALVQGTGHSALPASYSSIWAQASSAFW